MAFFEKKPDSELPLLTQAYQITLPPNWKNRFVDIGAERQPSPLLQSELDRFLLRCFRWGLLRHTDPRITGDDWYIHDKDDLRYYSDLFTAGDQVPLQHLTRIAEVLEVLKYTMDALTSPRHDGFRTVEALVTALYPINAIAADCPLSMLFACKWNPASDEFTLNTSAFDENRLVRWLLLDFANCASLPRGARGGLNACEKCGAIYAVKRSGQTFCSKRCGMRVTVQAGRDNKRALENNSLL